MLITLFSTVHNLTVFTQIFTQILCMWWCILHTMTVFLKLQKSQYCLVYSIKIYCTITPVS